MKPTDEHLSDRSMIERLVLLQEFSPRRQALDHAIRSAAASLGDFVLARWLLLVNLILGLFVGVAIMVPVFYAWGWSGLSSSLFRMYHLVCAQIPSHSYFLFGYQLALCARNLAIYGSLLLGSVWFRSIRDRLAPLKWQFWLLTMLPMAVDGFTQLFGLRESTWELRTVTGALFGFGVCWFLFPQVDAAVRMAVDSESVAASLPVSGNRMDILSGARW